MHGPPQGTLCPWPYVSYFQRTLKDTEASKVMHTPTLQRVPLYSQLICDISAQSINTNMATRTLILFVAPRSLL